jgi:hypothetical protein
MVAAPALPQKLPVLEPVPTPGYFHGLGGLLFFAVAASGAYLFGFTDFAKKVQKQMGDSHETAGLLGRGDGELRSVVEITRHNGDL